ncbi:hypothetical protein F2Q69_00053391 [Brassica cretica]|uniref:Uncharacterized protein n=1 Tax=Brassica cretica TaxID=69181 RepID=A0A8S9MW82_BRACR|nr:hypothetical protein F2Q69_00053391 [Brassica cretica]
MGCSSEKLFTASVVLQYNTSLDLFLQNFVQGLENKNEVTRHVREDVLFLEKEFSEEFNTQSVMKEIDMGCLRITSDYRSQQCRRLTLEDVMAS